MITTITIHHNEYLIVMVSSILIIIVVVNINVDTIQRIINNALYQYPPPPPPSPQLLGTRTNSFFPPLSHFYDYYYHSHPSPHL